MRSPKSNRICVLGDSHVVALRRALGRDPANLAGLDITLVASARDGMNNTRLAGSRLEATAEKIADQFIRTSGGKPYVDLANYDYLAICGLGLSLQSLFGIFNEHRLYDDTGALSDLPLISVGATEAIAKDIFCNSIGARLLAQIRTCSAVPVLVIPQPAPTSAIGSVTGKWPWLSSPGVARIVQTLHRIESNALQYICSQFGATPILQPFSTLAGEGFTLDAYHQLGMENDAAHMNADYGLLVLRQIQEFIEGVMDAKI